MQPCGDRGQETAEDKGMLGDGVLSDPWGRDPGPKWLCSPVRTHGDGDRCAIVETCFIFE